MHPPATPAQATAPEVSAVRARRRGAGQALAEYLVLTAALAVALLLPWGGGPSAAERLLVGLLRWHRHYLLAIGLS